MPLTNDPTELLLEVRDSFQPQPAPVYPQAFRLAESPAALPLFIQREDGKTYNPPAVFTDAAAYARLNELKDQFGQPGFDQARNTTNPFEFLGNSIFMSRAAIKFANLDAIYGVSGHNGGQFSLQTPGRFTFCDIAAGPGSFTQYLQWRRPESNGFGITLKGDLDWQMDKLDGTRFLPYYGPDNTGDLYVNWSHFRDYVLAQAEPGVDLVTGDGGFDVSAGQFHRQEFLSSRLILVECLTAVSVLREGGNFVCKLFDTVSKISADTLFMMAACFEEIILFKPISSRPANAERYLICRGRKAHIEGPVAVLTTAAAAYTADLMLTGFLAELPPAFESWLRTTNAESIQRQTVVAERILTLLQRQPLAPGPQYDLHKAFIYWNLPDNPPRRHTQIRVGK